MDIKQIIIEALISLGVDITPESQEKEDLDLTEYITDSIQFAGFIIELEDELGIELPYDYLSNENMRSLNQFTRLIAELT